MVGVAIFGIFIAMLVLKSQCHVVLLKFEMEGCWCLSGRSTPHARTWQKAIMAFSYCSHCRVELDTRAGALQKCFTFQIQDSLEWGRVETVKALEYSGAPVL
jgi:hypothetical protein